MCANLSSLIRVDHATRGDTAREHAGCHFEAVRDSKVGFGLRKQIKGEGEQRVGLWWL